jgi:N-acetyl-anhydromuramyl-L-alanine amidase AmpD
MPTVYDKDGNPLVAQTGYNKHSVVKLDTPNISKSKRSLDQITLGVVHYTGSSSLEGTLAWFQNPEAKVSSHFVIDRDGAVVQFGELEDILWHAGKSEWQGRKWCNKYSIGYEFVCHPRDILTPPQITSLIYLVKGHVARTGMNALVGHEHISPGRKVDPGNSIRWEYLKEESRLKLMDPEQQLEFIGSQRVERKDLIEEQLVEDQKLAVAENIDIEQAKEMNEIDRANSMQDGRGNTDLSWLRVLINAILKRNV